MRDSISPLCRMVGSVLFAAACLASGAAPAQVSTTSPVPMTHFFVVQPVDVCTDNPRLTTDCAYINNSFQTVRSSPTGANTLVGFLDPATGMLAHRNIWSQIGLDFRHKRFLQHARAATRDRERGSSYISTQHHRHYDEHVLRQEHLFRLEPELHLGQCRRVQRSKR